MDPSSSPASGRVSAAAPNEQSSSSAAAPIEQRSSGQSSAGQSIAVSLSASPTRSPSRSACTEFRIQTPAAKIHHEAAAAAERHRQTPTPAPVEPGRPRTCIVTDSTLAAILSPIGSQAPPYHWGASCSGGSLTASGEHRQTVAMGWPWAQQHVTQENGPTRSPHHRPGSHMEHVPNGALHTEKEMRKLSQVHDITLARIFCHGRFMAIGTVRNFHHV